MAQALEQSEQRGSLMYTCTGRTDEPALHALLLSSKLILIWIQILELHCPPTDEPISVREWLPLLQLPW